MLAARAEAREARVPRFTPVPSRRRLSTRGQVGQSWRTKRWTAYRLQSRDEHLYPNDQPERSYKTPLVAEFLYAGMRL